MLEILQILINNSYKMCYQSHKYSKHLVPMDGVQETHGWHTGNVTWVLWDNCYKNVLVGVLVDRFYFWIIILRFVFSKQSISLG